LICGAAPFASIAREFFDKRALSATQLGVRPNFSVKYNQPTERTLLICAGERLKENPGAIVAYVRPTARTADSWFLAVERTK